MGRNNSFDYFMMILLLILIMLLIVMIDRESEAQPMTYAEYRFVIGKIIHQTKNYDENSKEKIWNWKKFKNKYYTEEKLKTIYDAIDNYSKLYDINDRWLLANLITQSKLKYNAVGDEGASFGVGQLHCPDNGVVKCTKINKKKLFDLDFNIHAFTKWAKIRKQKCLKKMTSYCKYAKRVMGEPIIFGSLKNTIYFKRKIDLYLTQYRIKRIM
jgi:hypothetical protein